MTAAPDYRALGRRGGLTTVANNDMRTVAARARKNSPASIEYWHAKVDPAGELDLSDRDARAQAAMRLHFVKLAEKSARARGNKTDATKAGAEPASVLATAEAPRDVPES